MGHPLLTKIAAPAAPAAMAVAIALLAGGCLDWGSLYGHPAADDDAGTTNPDAAVVSTVGCSDGTAEMTAGDAVVACAGSWTVPGVAIESDPTCNRQAGNDGLREDGAQCNVSDLCSPGWHVCSGPNDLPADGGFTCDQLGTPGDVPPDPGQDPNTAYLYLTRQTTGPSGDNQMCTPDPTGAGADDVLGCGTEGATTTCFPFNRVLSLPDACPPPYACGDDPSAEALNVISIGSPQDAGQVGGVLCCRN